MYFWISVNDQLTVFEHHCQIAPLDAPETDKGELNRRWGCVMQGLQAAYPELQKDEKNRVFLAVSNLVKCLPPAFEEIDFAMHMSMAHHCLPEAARRAREKTIDTIIEMYFGAASSRPATVQPQLSVLRAQITLLPDALLENHLSSHCGDLLMCTIMNPITGSCDARSTKDLRTITTVVSEMTQNSEERQSIFGGLYFIYCMSAPDQRRAVVEFVVDPKSRKALALTKRANQMLFNRFSTLVPVVKVKALMNILSEIAASTAEVSDTLFNDIVQAQIVQTESELERTENQKRSASFEAFRRGVPMGQRGLTTHESLLKLRVANNGLNARLAKQRTAQGQTKPATSGLPTGITDMAPVHAWSVARLVRWIEGPLADRSTHGRLNRSTVVAREKEASAQDARERLQAGMAADTSTPTLTEGDVDLAMNDGLGATAQFFHDDIHEMAPLAKALGAAPALLERCLELQAPLQQLCDKPAAFDEEKSRALLQDAEGRIAELRKGIKAAEASTQLARRFSTQLAMALKAEALVLGKRHGGVIACPLRPTDWAWVAQMFHRRWLPQVTRLLIDGQPIALQPDQAVALYVTGSSQSNFAFDVSVHLWQRRAGCTSPPSELMDNCPPMNEADWFDTYIPCAVLHVPLAAN
ncbi:MAG: hypothetical protein DCF26_10980 [Burkholderiales bacterium]|nr:MAG: hypothetical protein DCF26_10980 [Burkholderiales bacterium]